jgi:hypothetical protein
MGKIVYEHQIRMMTNMSLSHIIEVLNTLSIDGWELMCVVEERHYFRRPKSVSEYHVNPENGKYELKQVLGG